MTAGINKTAKKSAKTQRKKPSLANDQPIELPEGMWERIRKKAHELWLQRGRRTGQALKDWLDAEAIVMEEIHEARE
ncbi:MAG TPA: DUF2934 domain-containing protein [Candidatus Polarisedimenticolia bacterium]|nr:DUF2934 domain-containing protein [Candidatus Polarisedimenticolia bacterium]